MGTLAINVTGVWKYTSSSSSSSTRGSRHRLLAASDADVDVSNDPIRRWIATRESKGVAGPSRVVLPHGRSLKQRVSREPVSTSSTVVYDKIRLTSWLVGVASTNAVYTYVQNIVASPKLYYGFIVTPKYKKGACRGQFKKGITQIILGYIGKS